MNISFFIAKRLYFNKTQNQRVSRLAVNIATMGVAVGLAVMIVSVCIILGFKGEISKKLLGFGGHIQILNMALSPEGETMPLVMDSAFCEKVRNAGGVKHVQRFSNKMGILKNDTDFKGILLKGIDEGYDLDFMRNHLVEGAMPTFGKDENKNEIVVSQTVANQMNLKVGDRIYAYFFEQSLKTRRFHVAAIYQTNMAQLDDNVVWCNLYTVNQLNNWLDDQGSGAELTTNDFNQLDRVYENVLQKVNKFTDREDNTYIPFTIKEIYSQVFEWLKLLDINIWLILGLMACVACITMVSGILIIILEKAGTIGVLKAMGATNGLLRRIFLHYAVFIMGRGLLYGNLLGLGIGFIQQKFGLVCLNPENYYVHAVPILFDFKCIILLNVATVLVCVFSFLMPAMLLSRIEPIKTMKFG